MVGAGAEVRHVTAARRRLTGLPGRLGGPEHPEGVGAGIRERALAFRRSWGRCPVFQVAAEAELA
eukprot:5719152-Lingulodinium_polyedra.AAC.1